MKDRELTIHFTDGSKMSLEFPQQTENAAAALIKLNEALAARQLLVEADGALLLIPLSQWMSTTLGTGPLAGRGIDLIVYGLIIMLIAALRPQGLLSLPWGRWFGRLVRRA